MFCAFQSESNLGIQLPIGFLLESDCQTEICWNPIGKWKPSPFQFQIHLSVAAGTYFYKTKDVFQLDIGNWLESNWKLEIHWNPIADWNPIGFLLEIGLESASSNWNWIRYALRVGT